MKTLIMILLSVTISLGAFAQHRFGGKGYYAPGTRVYIAPFSYGFGFGYPYFGYPYFGFPYYGYPYFGYPNYRNRALPYKLELQIQQIKNDYKGRIISARKDKSLSGKQRRQEIRTLKTDRDKDIMDAKMNFHNRGVNNQNRGMNNPNNRQDQGNQNQNQDQQNAPSDNSYKEGS